jgi:hypothetical protein
VFLEEKTKVSNHSQRRRTQVGFITTAINFLLIKLFLFAGRVHSAMVSKLNPEQRSVTVEWYERGETKGKEVELDMLLALNPELMQSRQSFKPPPQPVSQIQAPINLQRVSIHRKNDCVNVLLFSPFPTSTIDYRVRISRLNFNIESMSGSLRWCQLSLEPVYVVSIGISRNSFYM